MQFVSRFACSTVGRAALVTHILVNVSMASHVTVWSIGSPLLYFYGRGYWITNRASLALANLADEREGKLKRENEALQRRLQQIQQQHHQAVELLVSTAMCWNPLRCALRCAALRCAVLCCAVLCCAVLCCAVLCWLAGPSCFAFKFRAGAVVPVI